MNIKIHISVDGVLVDTVESEVESDESSGRFASGVGELVADSLATEINRVRLEKRTP